MRLSKTFSVLGLLLGAIFFALSLTPSLIPRSPFMQGVLAGTAFTFGYFIGVFVHWLWNYLELPDIPISHGVRKLLKRLALVACVSLIFFFLWRGVHWQNSVRALMGMQPVTGAGPFTVGSMALLIFLIFWGMGKGFRRIIRIVTEHLARHIPDRVALLVGLLVAIGLYWGILNGVLLNAGLQTVSFIYEKHDRAIAEGMKAPEDPDKTGGANSLLSWDSVGHQGRRFLTLGPTAEDIRGVAGLGREPIRVFVGLRAAETSMQRAFLALAELKRVNAFEREILLIATPTGAGWVDPGAVNTLEFLYRGDVATVAAQYSYLPSPIALLTDDQKGLVSARALFKVIYEYWEDLPVDTRPRLYLFGLSLGAQLSEDSFDFYDIIDDPIDGALWAGPPFGTGIWRTITDNRDPGTPAWLPQFKGGEIVRFGNQYGGYLGQEPWGRFRIAFLQHASDPIVFFDLRWMLQKPDWMERPRGPDVSPDLQWFPIVTMLQLIADLNLGIAPLEFGHRYSPDGYVLAWMALTEPPDWSEEELKHLRDKLKTYPVR
ncbi:alpha/beta-hydrolase family protein [uncultured Microbulbifer sp.]|uniref:alpha/beta hydrolase n=1 Tax=uncultured Microbulbifer sp. TaxID=348147 RepID=UPI00262053EA|nr:alpha/beta-hydrolase family protein [uncultured Microbulbifer sp.]